MLLPRRGKAYTISLIAAALICYSIIQRLWKFPIKQNILSEGKGGDFDMDELQSVLEKSEIHARITTDGYDLEYSDKSDKYKFVVFTKSATERSDIRNFLRTKSWLSYDWKDANHQSIPWKHYFLVGINSDGRIKRKNLEDENRKFSDLLITETIDTYQYLSYKMMWGFRYALKNINFKFLVILSEDSIVNVEGLDRYLTEILVQNDRRSTYLYGGPNCRSKKVMRTGKWATPLEEYPLNWYPPYCVGSGLIISRETVKDLLRLYDQDRQPVSKIDDAYLGILLQLSGKTPVTEIKNITVGCRAKRSDTFIITQIKPLSKGAGLLKTFMQQGYYCEQNVAKHAFKDNDVEV